ncbi:MAG: dicarboxylate/amino acid:cation symporter [Gammaproteobacteria bacterium]|nr:dicarboxylate/amino acid:cation symporter [Gammaproteobacteria bacterium]
MPRLEAMNLTARILTGMAVGVMLGVLIQQTGVAADHWLYTFVVGGVFHVGGKIFIASLMLMVVPLVLVSIVCGASSLSDGTSMGRLGAKTMGLYLTTTAIAITLALAFAILISPGLGQAADRAAPEAYDAPPAPALTDVLINIFPTNPVAAMAEGNMLQIIVFALLLGIAIARVGEAGLRVRALFDDLNAVLMRLITMLIELAPYGVVCLMGKLFAEVGWEEILKLGKYFFTVVLVLVVHVSIVYPTLLVVLGRVNPLTFFGKMREPMLVAFSTSSSGATLPVTLRTVEHRLGVHNEIASFAIPLGATINMDGTAIMQGVATVFIAQFFGIDLTIGDYLMVILTATLASIGTAAVPGVGLVMLTMVLTQVGLPVEGIMLIIGVDRLLDMMRTAVNVTGDATVATVVARSEGLFDVETFDDPAAGLDKVAVKAH